MKAEHHNVRSVRGAYWLIKLRWIAIAGTFATIFVAGNILHLAIRSVALYCVVAMLILENIISLLLLRRLLKSKTARILTSVGKIIHFQICIDLLLLTALLHYSGGIENPFIVYFVFHMAIASILLPVRESYLQATFAAALLSLLALLEYKAIIPHHCVKDFAVNGAHANVFRVFGTIGAMTSTFYLIVYMTSSVTTRLRQREKAYRLVNQELKQKDKIKDEYVQRVTHDIKGHLAAIQSCLDVVARKLIGPLNEQQQDFVNRADKRTRKLTFFTKALLRLTQIRLKSNFEMEAFSLKNTITAALETVGAKARDKSIELKSDIDLTEDKVLGNQFSIEEMVANLMFNAIKYTPQNGQVEIIAKNKRGSILVEISDTGIGIPKKDLPNVFDEFYRATNARKIEKDGTGLGLSIAKQIIERHHGKIWVESEENVGTKFSFILPETALANKT